MIDSKQRQKTWSIMGFMYGYPVCCVKSFIYRSTRGLAPISGPWTGSGFIPCKDHKKEATVDFNKFIEVHIAPNRVYHLPFPLDEAGDPGYKFPKQEKRRGKKKAP